MVDDSVDLTTVTGVRRYLADTDFASDTITVLSGGFANFTYRIRLNDSFEGKETFILKYAPPYFAASGGAIPLATERQKFEVEALRLVLKMHADGDIVTVPAIHLFDEEAHIVIIEDCGSGMDTRTLKQLVIDGALPQKLAEEIGAAIGHFLARMHAWNKEASFDMGIFTDNEVGKAMTSLVPYGYLISTLSGQSNITDLADPVLDISKSKLDVLSKLADTRSYEIHSTSESFTHGDFWPGNIMVSLLKESDEDTPRLDKLYVLDWEMAKAGLQGLDIGEFCTDMYLLRQFYPSRQEEASAIIRSFLSSYNRVRGSDEALARVTIAHMGAHLVAWTPQLYRWGNREKISGVVAEGVEFLSGGAEGTRAWLEGSLVGNLLL